MQLHDKNALTKRTNNTGEDNRAVTDDYIRSARVIRVIDGDTVIVDVDLGFYVWVRMSCRLAGINARELHAPGGPAAGAHLAGLLPEGGLVTVGSVRADKFAGRFDGVIRFNGEDINQRMVADGFAVRWDGSGTAPVPPWPIP